MPASAAPGSPLAISISTDQGGRLSNASRAPGKCLTASSIPSRPTSSKLSTAPPVASFASPSSATAAAGFSTPATATARETSRGNSFSATAVTTPKVPSAPISSCFKS